ncbi:YfiR family protein [Flammeovirgaceae bacterium SG7u.111]|nr:YfiR family protein [Flammeovirgaceae bacterium SG7u.132]WPO36820.1 YfiR family protein [Flammeovirgaceae bacterium SG7u.111]
MITKPKKALVVLILLISSFAISHTSDAQIKLTKGTDARRLFVYNFMKYVFWPNEDINKEFVITIVNNEEMYTSLSTSLNGSIHRGRKVVVKQVNDVNDIHEPSIVYLPKEESRHFKSIQKQVTGKATLLITDQQGLGKEGSSINFKEVNKYLKFEINMESMEKSHLRVAMPLKQLAIII